MNLQGRKKRIRFETVFRILDIGAANIIMITIVTIIIIIATNKLVLFHGSTTFP